jgi:Ca2+-binding RTX toxin-like protein
LSLSHVYADDSGAGAYTVSVTATDEDGDWTAATTVTVSNVAPTTVLGTTGLALAAAGGPFVLQEGSVFTLVIGGPYDPGSDTVTQYQIQWGDGSAPVLVDAPAAGANGVIPDLSVDHVYADGSALYAISVTLIDEDGTFANDTMFNVSVENAAPVIELAGAASVAEGAMYGLTLGSVFDPGADTVASYIVHWGDGETDTYAAAGMVTHAYLNVMGSVQRTITVDLVDEDGTFLEAGSKTLTVTEVAPVLELSGAASVIEGGLYTLTLGDFTDPGSGLGVIAVTGYTVDWGDGSVETFTTGGDVTHIYTQGTFVYAITVDVDSAIGVIENAGTLNVLVINAPPVIADLRTDALIVGDAGTGDAVLLSGTFTDLSPTDTHRAVIDWGDGTMELAVIAEDDGMGSIAGSHAYLTGGIFKVTVVLVDQDGSATMAATYALVTGARVYEGVLQVVGTAGEDHIRLEVESGCGEPDVLVLEASFLDGACGSSGEIEYELSGVTGIVALAGAGDDHFDVRRTLELPVLVSGGSGDDHIEATEASSIILGGAGNDHIDGSEGDDLLIGGAGDDHINGEDGNDIIVGGDGNDHLDGDDGNDIISGGAGNDHIDGGDGTDVVLLAGDESGYDVDLNHNGNGTVRDLNPAAFGNDGKDKVKKIEELLFGSAWSQAIQIVSAEPDDDDHDCGDFDWDADPVQNPWFSSMLERVQQGLETEDEDIVWIIYSV